MNSNSKNNKSEKVTESKNESDAVDSPTVNPQRSTTEMEMNEIESISNANANAEQTVEDATSTTTVPLQSQTASEVPLSNQNADANVDEMKIDFRALTESNYAIAQCVGNLANANGEMIAVLGQIGQSIEEAQRSQTEAMGTLGERITRAVHGTTAAQTLHTKEMKSAMDTAMNTLVEANANVEFELNWTGNRCDTMVVIDQIHKFQQKMQFKNADVYYRAVNAQFSVSQMEWFLQFFNGRKRLLVQKAEAFLYPMVAGCGPNSARKLRKAAIETVKQQQPGVGDIIDYLLFQYKFLDALSSLMKYFF